MFGHNQVVNRHAFDDAPSDSLMVTTIFPTLQGEGPFSGCPATFIRLTKCNLACAFCDTFFDAGEYMTFSHILSSAHWGWRQFYVKHDSLPFTIRKPMLVITGGEPLLQPNTAAFCRYAITSGYQVQIETNGMFFQDLPKEVHVVVSPKCNEATREYITPHSKMLKRADSLKFVVSADEPGYKEIPQFARVWLYQHPGEIFISPMNVYKTEPVPLAGGSLAQRVEQNERFSFWDPKLLDTEKNQMNHEYAGMLCMKYGLRLSLQSHLFVSLP
jgi:7-carboxy-7-deazaguanine synthase